MRGSNNHRVQDSVRPTLGVVAISYNEERDLPAFLEHLNSWVDEIVIVDDGSSDSTATIAREAGGQVTLVVSPRRPGEYFSHQRNKGIESASSDWLLHMDIDERVPPELADEILRVVCSHDEDAFRFRRANFFLHRRMRRGGWQRWNQVHLARRDVLHFDGMYHEECRVNAPPERVGQLTNRMLHLNDADYFERMRKSQLYCLEVATKIRESGKRIHAVQLVSAPAALFLKRYVFGGGFLDGTAGLISALHSASAEFRSYAIVWDEQNRIQRETIENSVRDRWRRWKTRNSLGR